MVSIGRMFPLSLPLLILNVCSSFGERVGCSVTSVELTDSHGLNCQNQVQHVQEKC